MSVRWHPDCTDAKQDARRPVAVLAISSIGVGWPPIICHNSHRGSAHWGRHGLPAARMRQDATYQIESSSQALMVSSLFSVSRLNRERPVLLAAGNITLVMLTSPSLANTSTDD